MEEGQRVEVVLVDVRISHHLAGSRPCLEFVEKYLPRRGRLGCDGGDDTAMIAAVDCWDVVDKDLQDVAVFDLGIGRAVFDAIVAYVPTFSRGMGEC